MTLDWDSITVAEATALQEQLRGQVRLANSFAALAEIKTVAGIDAAYDADDNGRAAVVVFSFPDLQIIEQTVARRKANFPYTPGLLSFREMPLALAALQQLQTSPDLLILDGQGYAHPRRFGLACHLGLYLDKPAIGCAKKRLTGQFTDPGPQAGDYSLLEDGGETIGAVLRTAAGVKPVFISPGHKIDLTTAISLIMQCCRGYRLPEPTRQADILAGQ